MVRRKQSNPKSYAARTAEFNTTLTAHTERLAQQKPFAHTESYDACSEPADIIVVARCVVCCVLCVVCGLCVVCCVLTVVNPKSTSERKQTPRTQP